MGRRREDAYFTIYLSPKRKRTLGFCRGKKLGAMPSSSDPVIGLLSFRKSERSTLPPNSCRNLVFFPMRREAFQSSLELIFKKSLLCTFCLKLLSSEVLFLTVTRS